MTSDLDFYAHVATRGEVLGAGIGAQPAQWEAALGTDYLDIEEADLLRRDYGLVELSFQKDDDAWPCRGVSLQVHRLSLDTDSEVPASLRDVYGEFAPAVRFEQLTGTIAGLGHCVEHEPDAAGTSPDIHRHRVPESGVRIFVRTPEGTQRQTGAVWSLSVSPAWWRHVG
ncbi:hypothetical protein KQH42_02260 [Streptomyces sp. CHA1]|uniref:hypothetical protein n=1 Tax=Streptomyces TaxID=1883 RepID=UPI00030BAAD6|nr:MULTISPECIES: hypothetical protein [unclassified Streptomyces]QOZ98296.1 hypothetical protein DI273_02835 [Streptomyces violascens]WDV30670.1 hypothetical protein OIM90_02465 [Streptomyces sp. AD16]WSB23657.1 hypothetical protein OHB02_27405 [Streptomyces albidoflavus]MBT3159137.1 hypothetical protein [Streptomyces sp. G11C]MCO6699399.1 hypothetical protein [Streptomyces sp. CHB9.2]